MKKICLFMSLILFLCLYSNQVALAAEIPRIDVEAIVNEDGSVSITEIWETKDVFSGTQLSRYMSVANTMKVHSLTVTDLSGTPFQKVEDWSLTRSFDDRAYRTSLMVDGSDVEIWWGLTRYGDNRFYVSYTIDHFLEGFRTGAAFFHQFIPSGLDPVPHHVSLTLRWDQIVADVNYSYVVFGPDYELVEFPGGLRIESRSALRSNDGLALGFQFDASVLGEFNLSVMHNENLDVYEFNDPFSSISFWAIFFVIGMLVFGGLTILFGAAYLLSKTKLSDGSVIRYPSVKDIPMNEVTDDVYDIPAWYYFATSKGPLPISGDAFNCMSAYLLKWHQLGFVEVTTSKNETVLTLYTPPDHLSKVEQSLFDVLFKYADVNGKISSKSEKKWVKIGEFLDGKWARCVKRLGEQSLLDAGILARDAKEVVRFTPEGYQELVSFWGRARYLKSPYISDVSENQLILATLLGFQKSLKQCYDSGLDVNDDMMNFWLFFGAMHLFNHQSQAHYQSSIDASSSMGGLSGGVSSGGGGGGIS